MDHYRIQRTDHHKASGHHLPASPVVPQPWVTARPHTTKTSRRSPGLATAQVTDQLVVRALQLAFAGPHRGVPCLTPSRVLQLSAMVLAAHTSRGSVVVAQHLNARLVTYGRHLLPRDHWYITAADHDAGALLWHHDDPDLPDVLDVLATGYSQSVGIGVQHIPTPGRVVRTCDLGNPRDSVLQFPGDAHTFPWATVDDPLRYGHAALTSSPTGVPFEVSA